MARLQGQLGFHGLAIAAALLCGCASKVLQPPRVDLGGYGAIGLIELSSNAEGSLPEFGTQELIQSLQASQPGVRILELGGQERALRSVEHADLDFEAIRAIGRRHGVDAVIVGSLDVTEVKPRVQLSSLLSMNVQADVEARLSARLLETGSGATAWTRSAHRRASVAHVRIREGRPAHFGARDPESAYGGLVRALVDAVTVDFRPYYR